MSTTAQASTRLITAEEYLAMPEDEFKAELIDGEIVMSPRASGEHQEIVYRLAARLDDWVRPCRTGRVLQDVDVTLDERLVYAPDVVFLSLEHKDRYRRGRIFGPPDLAVEIISPGSVRMDRVRKFRDYLRYGVRWYWIMEQEGPVLEEYEAVEGVYVRRTTVEGEESFSPLVFPGLTFPLKPLAEDVFSGE
jgi:Uma2 family endonuclease